jgi:hypothetical protein
VTARWPYAAALFLAATLSFAIEPMAGKALQPALGGVPAVWTTCLLFFQLALLGGYFAQFALARVRSESARLGLHALLLSAPLVIARYDLVERASLAARERSPVLGALWFLAATVGAPFLALSTVAPAVQRYFTRATGEAPYRLYAASNLGSAAGLFAYPLLIERALSLGAQSIALRVAYAIVAVGVLAIGALALRAPATSEPTTPSTTAVEPRADNDRWWTWLVLAGLPSALLATTSATIASDLPGIPLLWVTPLAVYLLTFVAAFSRAKPAPAWVGRALAMLALVLLPVTVRRTTSPYALLLVLHLGYLALASFAFHARLASLAPAASKLERFYLAAAVGGALGTLVFGVLPSWALADLWEIPLCVALACVARFQGERDEAPAPKSEWARVLAPAAWLLALALAVRVKGWAPAGLLLAVAYVPAILASGTSSARPRAFVLALVGFALGASVFEGASSVTLARGRSFFGTTRVQAPPGAGLHVLVHGTTVHGTEKIEHRGQCVPRAYYWRDGPFGRAMAARRSAFADGSVLGVGLGAGSIVCFARPGERWTFVEIDPDVVRVARDRRLFTFLSDNPLGHPPEVLVGDGRLVLRDEPAGARSMVIVDAFNSDSVPLHLLTREALALDVRALAAGGWLVVHISNRALDLPRVLSSLVRDAGLAARVNADATEFTGRGNVATWAVIARNESELTALGPQWIALPDPRGLAPFTDAHASIVPIIRW